VRSVQGAFALAGLQYYRTFHPFVLGKGRFWRHRKHRKPIRAIFGRYVIVLSFRIDTTKEVVLFKC
jgi:hypothetical protein